MKDLVLFDDMQPTTKRPIVTEDYNELVFVDPSPTMLRYLTEDLVAPAAQIESAPGVEGGSVAKAETDT